MQQQYKWKCCLDFHLKAVYGVKHSHLFLADFIRSWQHSYLNIMKSILKGINAVKHSYPFLTELDRAILESFEWTKMVWSNLIRNIQMVWSTLICLRQPSLGLDSTPISTSLKWCEALLSVLDRTRPSHPRKFWMDQEGVKQSHPKDTNDVEHSHLSVTALTRTWQHIST